MFKFCAISKKGSYSNEHFLVNFVAVTARLGREIFPVVEERLRDELKERLRRRLGSVVISPKKSED